MPPPTRRRSLRRVTSGASYAPLPTGASGIPAWAATTAYPRGALVIFSGSVWMANAAFTSGASFDATNWTLIEGSGLQFPSTLDLTTFRSTSADALPVQAVNAAHFLRCRDGGTITKVGLFVGTQSGNISVGVYRNSGTGRSVAANAAPGVRAATSGAVSCPAPGYAEVSLLASVVFLPGDWLAFSADNTTATFRTILAAAADSAAGRGVQARQSAGHPLPDPAGALTNTIGYNFYLVGVA